MGIEVDKEGRRVAYWIWTEHPGEMLYLSSRIGQRIRIEAADMIHVFTPIRIGQMRGRPWLASIIVKMHELDQYEDAELVRKKTAAMFGGFITQQAGEDSNPGMLFGRNIGQDVNLSDIIAIEPGTFPALPAGKDVKFSQPVDVGQTYEVWIKQQLREIAVGMGVTYEQLTNDLSGVNYSSIRAGLLEFRRRVNQMQYQIIIHQFCRPIARRWMDAAVLSRALPIPVSDYLRYKKNYLRINWTPDGWPWVDPVKDQIADQMEIRNGFNSRARVVARRGDDVEVIDEEIAEDNKRADAAGLILDTDPRKTGKSGAMQKAEAAAFSTDEPPAKPAKGEEQ
jgi:lambda family phage portal protein